MKMRATKNRKKKFPLAVKARTVTLKPSLGAEEAFRLVLLECLAHVSANVPGVVQKGDEKALHKLRVGLRRLDAALRALKKVSDAPGVAALKLRVKAFLKATSPARDLDVFASMLPGMVKESKSPKSVAMLHAHVEVARKKAWTDAVRQVRALSFSLLLDDIAVLAEWRAQNPSGKHAIKAAREALDKSLRKCRKRGVRFTGHTPDARHHLRIGLKRRRYEAEFFASLFNRDKTKRYLKTLRQLQQLLGEQQDLAAMKGNLRKLAAGPRYAVARKDILRQCAERGKRLEKAAAPVWKEFRNAAAFWG